MDKLSIHGTCDGFDTQVDVSINNTDWDNPEFVSGIIANVQNWGIKAGASPTKNPANVNAAPPSASAPTPQPMKGGGQGCEWHGTAQGKAAFRGPGYECGAYDANQQPWTKAKPSQMRDGSQRWYCNSKWY